MWPFSEPYPERHVEDIGGKAFDYIIVGGGTAGCVVASRLSENPNVSVLLLEKGLVNDTKLSRIPLLSANFFWTQFQTIHDRHSQPMPECNGRRAPLWGAEGLGGNSRVNGMMVTRGIPSGFTEWAAMGLNEWGWEQVEPYFRKMESAKGHPGKVHHGHDGPMENRQFTPQFEHYKYIKKACTALGLPIEDDLNDPAASAQGYFTVDTAVDKKGERISTYRAYLSKAIALQRRSHLTICTGVIASKLHIDENKRTTGVYVQKVAGGKEVFVKANREVVVCNGAFRSPQLLLLSGIGPKKHLMSTGVECIKDLPSVGANLKDHFSVPIMLQLPIHDNHHTLSRTFVAIWHLILYFLFNIGLMASPLNCATIFVRTTSLDETNMTVEARSPAPDGSASLDNMDASQPRNIPDVEVMLNSINSVTSHLPENPVIALYTTLVQPYSSGQLELASKDPLKHPRVRYGMFTDDRDWVTMRKATRFVLKMAEEFRESGYPYPCHVAYGPGMDMEELNEIVKHLQDGFTANLQPVEGNELGATKNILTSAESERALKKLNLQFKPVDRTWKTVTDEEIDSYSRQVALTSLHFSCTCRMSLDEKDGVVDQRLRVHGIHNLRIADTSVFPKIPSAHTMAPAIMVAERCADFLKEDWKTGKN